MLKLMSHSCREPRCTGHERQPRISWTESSECAPYFAQAGQPAQRIWQDFRECAPYFAQVEQHVQGKDTPSFQSIISPL